MGPTCDWPACPSGHYKYDNCLIEALHMAYGGMIGSADEECGDTKWRAYYWLILLPDGERIGAAEWDGPADMVIGAGSFFIMSTTGQGFVYLTPFDTADLARAAYDDIEREYCLWFDVDHELMGLEAVDHG